ncbi:Uncharacterised protein [Porphyromonas cangingivalis]|nr:Uncharacterised protein [Porphyromonas cangingivalis]
MVSAKLKKTVYPMKEHIISNHKKIHNLIHFQGCGSMIKKQWDTPTISVHPIIFMYQSENYLAHTKQVLQSWTAIAVILTMSVTVASWSVKYTGLRSPIWIGPTTSSASSASRRS